MRRQKVQIATIILACVIMCLYASCSASEKHGNALLPDDNSDQAENQPIDSDREKDGLKEAIVLKIKDIDEFRDKELSAINKPVLAVWFQSGCHVMIIPVDDKGGYLLEDYFSLDMNLDFHYPGGYDAYYRYGAKADIYVEKFIENVNEKHENGTILKKFIRRDLVVTLEYSDGSEIIFDRYYKEIEENMDDFREVLYSG